MLRSNYPKSWTEVPTLLLSHPRTDHETGNRPTVHANRDRANFIQRDSRLYYRLVSNSGPKPAHSCRSACEDLSMLRYGKHR
jgi:hypothetical protein